MKASILGATHTSMLWTLYDLSDVCCSLTCIDSTKHFYYWLSIMDMGYFKTIVRHVSIVNLVVLNLVVDLANSNLRHNYEKTLMKMCSMMVIVAS